MINTFVQADRESIRRTIRYMHTWRSLNDKLPAVTVPTLFITGDLRDQRWRPTDAEAAATTMSDCRVVAVSGTGHLGPLQVNVDEIAAAIAGFWGSLQQHPRRV
ncbi:alpha/beta fold hydrolase [Mycobacterium sp. JS623]|uniref:alpha/beta fold hydrolase n=1 Tax=Mycobacterium sp. JS623 TaxID=212767 RepID=UPI0002F056A5|nr:hypothetical protein [Mycobacterium sp. JS623]